MHFFPDLFGLPSSVFGWTFLVLMFAGAVVAAVWDQTTGRIPNVVNLVLLISGLVMNVIRGALLASAGEAVWLWSDVGPALGALDGFLFGLAGFGLAFALFFIQWILGVCGGGDLKLFAAIGAWAGATRSIYLLIGTLVCVALLLFVRGAGRLLLGRPLRLQRPPSNSKKAKALAEGDDQGHGGKRRRADTIYAPAMALSVALVSLWIWRYDLGIAAHPTRPHDAARVSGLR